MKQRVQLRVYYWRQNALIGNLGDALVPSLLQALGYDPVPPTADGPWVCNPGRTLIVIGSILTDADLAALAGPIDVWGCGWKGKAPNAATLAKLRIHAVRGPQTVAALGLPPATPLGDPALLLPRLLPRRSQRHGRTVVMPHLHRTAQMSVQARCRQTGCAEMVATQIFQAQGLKRRAWGREALAFAKVWLRCGVPLRTTWHTVERIAGADFVLTGSLHGAILAQTYGVPWAAYDDGYIDAPAKWQDWAAYLGVRLAFVTNLAAGQQWWQSEGKQGALRDLDPLLAAFPYAQSMAHRKEIDHAANA